MERQIQITSAALQLQHSNPELLWPKIGKMKTRESGMSDGAMERWSDGVTGRWSDRAGTTFLAFFARWAFAPSASTTTLKGALSKLCLGGGANPAPKPKQKAAPFRSSLSHSLR